MLELGRARIGGLMGRRPGTSASGGSSLDHPNPIEGKLGKLRTGALQLVMILNRVSITHRGTVGLLTFLQLYLQR